MTHEFNVRAPASFDFGSFLGWRAKACDGLSPLTLCWVGRRFLLERLFALAPESRLTLSGRHVCKTHVCSVAMEPRCIRTCLNVQGVGSRFGPVAAHSDSVLATCSVS